MHRKSITPMYKKIFQNYQPAITGQIYNNAVPKRNTRHSDENTGRGRNHHGL